MMNNEWVLRQGLQDCIPEVAVDKILAAQRPLKIKFGADPSAPDLHFGHMVVLKKLQIGRAHV